MAKITVYIPEPSVEYNPNQQQQVLQALDTLRKSIKFWLSKGLEK
jgi:hypothetical protein